MTIRDVLEKELLPLLATVSGLPTTPDAVVATLEGALMGLIAAQLTEWTIAHESGHEMMDRHVAECQRWMLDHPRKS